ncbi:MAG TPA: TIM barrel protein [Bryobacteraceae bacterium]|jgi:hydroxypyruvate isomerase|nr:TIM barrel protein [Bryobacteraceae bacterium]
MITRRSFIPLAAAAVSPLAYSKSDPQLQRGRLKQSVTQGVFKGRQMTLDDMCRESAEMGIYGFDLIDPKDWPTLKKYGLVPTMGPPPYGGTIPDALNRKENHDRIRVTMTKIIDQAAGAGVPNVITFSGNRRGMSDEEGADNCVLFLNSIKSYAEDKNVTICMELLNSKVNHKDYMCDHAAWGAGVMKRVNSPRVKLLYDIYHMQIMDGDIVRTVRDNIQYIGHFHTGGNPGRHEIDGTQELNYRFVAQSIADLGYTGVVAHEYTPVREPIESLKQAIQIFTV